MWYRSIPIALLLMAVGVLFVFSAAAEAKTIIVDDDWSGADYSTIGEAIAAASAGDTSRVYDGTFKEASFVNKALDLVGNGTGTIIDGTGKDHTFGFSLMGGGCNVSGFQFYYWWPTHEFGAIGIYSDGNRVFDNLFYYNARGIFLDQCKKNHIFNNTFLQNQYGVCVTNSAGECSVSFNIFTKNRGYGSYGILYGRSTNYAIISNTFHNYTTSAIGIHRSDNVTISFNMFEASLLEEGRRRGLTVYECTDTDIHNNTFVNHDKTVTVGRSINTLIVHNSISDSNYGIWVYPSGDGFMSIGTEVHFNNIFDNAVYGIDATNNTGAVVNATHNWWGDPSGPYHPVDNSLGIGDELTDNVDFDPWLGKRFSPLPPIAFIVDLRPSLATEGDPVLFVGRGLARNYTDLQIWRSSIDGGIYSGPSFAFTRRDLSNGTHTIYLKVRDEYGRWSEEVSTTLVVNGRPRAMIETLSPTLTNEGETVSFEGSFFDHENDVTTYRWISDIDGFISFRLEFSTDELSNGTHNITFEVRDGHKVWSHAAVGHVTVNGLPLAWIVDIDPVFVNGSKPIIFRGDALDHEKNISRFEWLSDIDGELSDQKMFGTSSLSNGTHTITFKVMDGYGEWSEPATASVTVNGIPIAIIVTISPNPGTQGDFVNFRGSYIDDGNSIVSYEWESDIDGTLSFIKDFATSDLASGTHVVTFKVMDRDRVWSQEATATLVVNGRPKAIIEAIEPDMMNEGDEVRFQGTFKDREDDIREFLWASDIDGILSVQSAFSISDLSCGLHTITFRVMDSYGCWSGNATASITVNGIPSAEILGIEPSLANEGDVIVFSGGYVDFEEMIPEFEWVSDIDGLLSTEKDFSISRLSVGIHAVSFRVRDSFEVWSEPSTSEVTVNGIPLARIVLLRPNPALKGADVTFRGEGVDDGEVNECRWSSDIDGPFGHEFSLTWSDLSPGDHVIRFEVMDDNGVWSGAVSERLEILERDVRLEILGIDFPSSATEGEVVSIEGDIRNVGDFSSSSIVARFFYDNETLGHVTIETPLEPGSEITVTIDWAAVVGIHMISLEVEHEGAILASERSSDIILVAETIKNPGIETSEESGERVGSADLVAISVAFLFAASVVTAYLLWSRRRR